MLRRRATGGIDHGRAAALPCTIASPAPPKLFLACSDDASPERAEGVMSPTSILQAANLTSSATCVHGGAASRGGNGHHRPWEGKPVGLGLVGALNGEAPGASWEFGVASRSGASGGDPALADSRRHCMSPREMEMSEDYTCVIARGPNPRTTHIFDNRVVDVDSRGGFSSASAGTNDFLRYCHGCNKDIGQGKDIYMYRGEKAFCSRECRYQDMLFDGGMDEL